MTKWDYIRLISGCGDRYGCYYGVNDLLEWYEKLGTREITDAEAKDFYEMISMCSYENTVQKKRGFSKVRKALKDYDYIYLGGR